MVTDFSKWVGVAGDGFFRLVEIDEAAAKIRVKTFSAFLNQSRSDTSGQFECDLAFEGRFASVSRPKR